MQALSSPLVIKPLGESALIIEVPDHGLDYLIWLSRELHLCELNGVTAIIPAYHTLTLRFDPLTLSYEALVDYIRELMARPYRPQDLSVTLHKIPVCYAPECAPDLDEMSETLAMPREHIITTHHSTEYRVAGVGFCPGFGFLSGLPEQITCKRKSPPRPVVPSGSVGIAGSQTGIYPSETSGGWNLIGRSPMDLVDYNLPKPSLLQVGDRVRFHPITLKQYHAA